jgi:hypothetical protein
MLDGRHLQVQLGARRQPKGRLRHLVHTCHAGKPNLLPSGVRF